MRVVGLPGDRVACCDSDGRVTVDGKRLNETYLYPGDAPSAQPFSVTLARHGTALGPRRSSEHCGRLAGLGASP
ncbi:MAG: S26 family signal peptidase [Trebonia sp.]